ncbi:transposase [Salmonella enterica]|uniref:transposase n=1 Tax=Salmonella enterica TaxID=28901 RepID=UPI000DEC96C0|nr:hypothetical protein CHE29_09605 [Salmonella enterica]
MLWCCQYYIVWTPKCQFRILRNNVGKKSANSSGFQVKQLGIEIVELNVPVGLCASVSKIPPKLSISHVVGTSKCSGTLNLDT